MAFSMAPSTPRSQGWMTIWCGSGTLMLASWLSGVMRAVVLDLDALHQGGGGAARADGREVALHGLHGPLHARLECRRPVSVMLGVLRG